MRTTITLDADVARTARTMMAQSGKPFKQIVNDAMRSGFRNMGRRSKPRRYKTRGKAMRLRDGLSLDNVQELLARIEGDDAR
jgi:hypothetical protein